MKIHLGKYLMTKRHNQWLKLQACHCDYIAVSWDTLSSVIKTLKPCKTFQIVLYQQRTKSDKTLVQLDQRGVTTKSDKFFFVTYPQTNIGLRKKWKIFFCYLPYQDTSHPLGEPSSGIFSGERVTLNIHHPSIPLPSIPPEEYYTPLNSRSQQVKNLPISKNSDKGH